MSVGLLSPPVALGPDGPLDPSGFDPVHQRFDVLSFPERYGPNTELITGISRTVGEIALSHALGRNDPNAQERARMASGLSALGSVLTRKNETELLETKANVIEASKKPLPIDAILVAHAAQQDAILRSSEITMNAESKKKDNKRRKKDDKKDEEEDTNRITSLLRDAIERAHTDVN